MPKNRYRCCPFWKVTGRIQWWCTSKMVDTESWWCHHFSCCCGQIPDRKQLKGREVCFGFHFRGIQPITTGKPWQQVQKAADLPVLIVRKQRTDKVGSVHKVSRPTSVALFLKVPQLSKEVPQAGDQVFKTWTYGKDISHQKHELLCCQYYSTWEKDSKKSSVLLTASNSKPAGNLITPGYSGDKI